MKRTTLILVRHGETVANVENIFRGRQNFPLNDNGRRQAKLLAEALAKYDVSAIYSSPLSRALETAKAVAQKFSLGVVVEPKLTNISLGSWEGKPHTEIAKLFPKEYDLWRTEPERLVIPGGETLSEVQARAFEAVERIVSENEGKTVVVVSHRAVLKPLIAALIGIKEPYFWKIHMDNASYSIVYHTKLRGYMLYQLNRNDHLESFVFED